MSATELLSPAGSAECAYAAFRYGADAVYCGLRKLSARAEAVNLSLDELRDVCAYAHRLPKPRRVYVTLNTLISTAELPDAATSLIAIADAGADAVIIQDAGVLRLAKDYAPTLERHASTQLAIHSLAGARQALAMGFQQVTLAREMSFDEIREVTAAGIKTEAFIHGALCYSYSGLCLLSSHKFGRSGNRGKCAYPCREDYGLDDGSHHSRMGMPEAPGGSRTILSRPQRLPFSMKDLCLSESVLELAHMGVRSLKIEGRMKGALYVAAVTDFYRQILDGKLRDPGEIASAENDIRTVFSRPWTRLYSTNLKNKDVIDPDMTGNRGAPVGVVETVSRDRDGTRWLTFHTRRALELHDGLQFDVPGQKRLYGFSIKQFAGPGGVSVRSPVFHQRANSWVTVELPDDAPHIAQGMAICCTSSQAVKQRYDVSLPPAAERKQRFEADVTVSVTCDAVRVSVAANGSLCTEASCAGPYTPAKDVARMESVMRATFEKLGETEFALRHFTLHNEGGFFVPMSHLNHVRRDAFEKMSALRAEDFERRINAVTLVDKPSRTNDAESRAERWVVRADRPESIESITNADEILLNIVTASDCCQEHKDTIRWVLPVICRRWERETLQRHVRERYDQGYRKFSVANVASFEFVKDLPGIDLHADWTLNSLNPCAVQEWRERGCRGLTLSPEDTRANVEAMAGHCGDIATVILYQDTPLMISEACPRHALTGTCDACAEKAEGGVVALSASKGRESLLVKSANCRATIFGERALCWATHLQALRAMGYRSFRIDFTLKPYTADEAREIWETVRAGTLPPWTHPGNWGREF